MSKTAAVNPNRPASTGETPRLGDNVIRTLAAAVAELLNVDHYMGTDSGSGYTEDAAGEHTRIKFTAPLSAKPTAAANKGFLYTKDISNVVELFWEHEDGTELQLTSAGVLNPAIACGITGNQSIAGIKTFTSIPILPASSPTTGNQATRKTYVDAQDTIITAAAAAAAAAQSFGVATVVDSEGNAFLKDHAYLAAQDGIVHAFGVSGLANRPLKGYHGATTDPVGAGLLMAHANAATNGAYALSITFAVPSGRYWEITNTIDSPDSIIWQPTQTTGTAPVDQD